MWIISGVAMLGAMMSILDTTIVNVALATLGKDLHSSLSNIQWVITGYMLSLAAVIPVTGWASRRFGTKPLFLVSLVLFTGGSLLCGLATSDTELIAFRVLQGCGGGMLMPVAQIIMADAAGPKRMGRVMGLVAVPMMLAPTLGPLLGGAIIQTLDWHWIFYVNIIVGAFALPMAVRLLPTKVGQRTDQLDFLGLVLMSTGLVGITYGLAETGTLGTVDSAKVYAPVIAGLALVVAFAFHALRVKYPLLDLRLYKRWHFSAASIVMFSLGAAVFGAMILMPLYWQDLRHFDVIDTGLLTGPQGIGMAAAMPLAAKLTERYGGGPVALVGVLVTAVMTIPFAPDRRAHERCLPMCLDGAPRGWDGGLLHAGDDGRVRGAGAPRGVARNTTIERTEPRRRLDRHDRAGGRAGALPAACPHRHGGRARYGTAFWWSVGLAALSIIPCVVLMRAESNARRAARERRQEP